MAAFDILVIFSKGRLITHPFEGYRESENRVMFIYLFGNLELHCQVKPPMEIETVRPYIDALQGQITKCDAVLVTAAKAGDLQAYAELCRRHSTQIFRTVLRIVKNVEDADDALQESLMKGFVHLAGFR